MILLKTEFYSVLQLNIPSASDLMKVATKTTTLTEDDIKSLGDGFYIF